MDHTDVSNVNDIYFNGIYKDIWKSLIPQKLTDDEVSFMMKCANLQPGSQVLDMMCGFGRHAIGLARNGCHITAVDNLDTYINELTTISAEERLPIECIQQHVLDFKSPLQFDLAICMGNSLNFFDRADSLKLLSLINQHLKIGGKLLINSWSIAEIVIKDFIADHTGKKDDIIIETQSEYLFQPTRIETTNVFTLPNGTKEEKKAIDFVFSFAEMEAMLAETGYRLVSAESIPGRKKFTLGDPRIYMVAEKVSLS